MKKASKTPKPKGLTKDFRHFLVLVGWPAFQGVLWISLMVNAPYPVPLFWSLIASAILTLAFGLYMSYFSLWRYGVRVVGSGIAVTLWFYFLTTAVMIYPGTDTSDGYFIFLVTNVFAVAVSLLVGAGVGIFIKANGSLGIKVTATVLLAILAYFSFNLYQLSIARDGTQNYSGAKLLAAQNALVQVRNEVTGDGPGSDFELQDLGAKLQVVSVEPTTESYCLSLRRFGPNDPEYYDVTTRDIWIFGPESPMKWPACGILY